MCGRDSCQQQRKAAQNGTKALNLAVHCAGLFKNVFVYSVCVCEREREGPTKDYYRIHIRNYNSQNCTFSIAQPSLPVTEVEKILSNTFQFCMEYNCKSGFAEKTY